MNSCNFTARLTRDPEIRYTESQMAILRFSGAVNKRFKKENEPSADFLNFVVFGKNAESLEKYAKKGTKLELNCHVKTGSYTNKDGVKVYTTDFIVDSWEFAESKASSEQNQEQTPPKNNDDWVSVPDGIDEQIPFL